MKDRRFNCVYCSSEDPNFTFNNVFNPTATGWISEENPYYPFEAVIDLQGLYLLDGLELVSHESKIASRIDLFVSNNTLLDTTGLNTTNYQYFKDEFEWKSIGYFEFSNNERSFWIAREFKKVIIPTVPATYVRLVFSGCHSLCPTNIYKQIGLISLNFLGTQSHIPKLRGSVIELFDDLLREKKDAIEHENYNLADLINIQLENAKKNSDLVAKLISKKNTALANEEYIVVEAIINTVQSILNQPLNYTPDKRNPMNFLNLLNEEEDEEDIQKAIAESRAAARAASIKEKLDEQKRIDQLEREKEAERKRQENAETQTKTDLLMPQIEAEANKKVEEEMEKIKQMEMESERLRKKGEAKKGKHKSGQSSDEYYESSEEEKPTKKNDKKKKGNKQENENNDDELKTKSVKEMSKDQNENIESTKDKPKDKNDNEHKKTDDIITKEAAIIKHAESKPEIKQEVSKKLTKAEEKELKKKAKAEEKERKQKAKDEAKAPKKVKNDKKDKPIKPPVSYKDAKKAQQSKLNDDDYSSYYYSDEENHHHQTTQQQQVKPTDAEQQAKETQQKEEIQSKNVDVEPKLVDIPKILTNEAQNQLTDSNEDSESNSTSNEEEQSTSDNDDDDEEESEEEDKEEEKKDQKMHSKKKKDKKKKSKNKPKSDDNKTSKKTKKTKKNNHDNDDDRKHKKKKNHKAADDDDDNISHYRKRDRRNSFDIADYSLGNPEQRHIHRHRRSSQFPYSDRGYHNRHINQYNSHVAPQHSMDIQPPPLLISQINDQRQSLLLPPTPQQKHQSTYAHHHSHHHQYANDRQPDAPPKSIYYIPKEANQLVELFGEEQVVDVYSDNITTKSQGIKALCGAIRRLGDPDKQADSLETLYPILVELFKSDDPSIYSSATEQVINTVDLIPDECFPYDVVLELLKIAISRIASPNKQISDDSISFANWASKIDGSFLEQLIIYELSQTPAKETKLIKLKFELLYETLKTFGKEAVLKMRMDDFMKYLIPFILSDDPDQQETAIKIYSLAYEKRGIKMEMYLLTLSEKMQEKVHKIIASTTNERHMNISNNGDYSGSRSPAQQLAFLNVIFGEKVVANLNSQNLTNRAKSFARVCEILQSIPEAQKQYDAYDCLIPYIKQMFHSDNAIIFVTAVDSTSSMIDELSDNKAFKSIGDFPYDFVRELVEICMAKLAVGDKSINEAAAAFCKWAVFRDDSYLDSLLEFIFNQDSKRSTSNIYKNKLDLMNAILMKYESIITDRISIDNMMQLVLENFESANQDTKEKALELYATCYNYYGEQMDKFVRTRPKKVQKQIVQAVTLSESYQTSPTLRDAYIHTTDALSDHANESYLPNNQIAQPRHVLSRDQKEEAKVLIELFGNNEVGDLYSNDPSIQADGITNVCNSIKSMTAPEQQLQAFRNLVVILKKLFSSSFDIVVESAVNNSTSTIEELQEDEVFVKMDNFPHKMVEELISVCKMQMAVSSPTISDSCVKFISWSARMDATFLEDLIAFIFKHRSKNDNKELIYQSQCALLDAVIQDYEEEITSRISLKELMDVIIPALECNDNQKSLQLCKTCYNYYGSKMLTLLQNKPIELRNQVNQILGLQEETEDNSKHHHDKHHEHNSHGKRKKRRMSSDE